MKKVKEGIKMKLEFKNFKEKLEYLEEYPEKMEFALEELHEIYPTEVEKCVDLAIRGKHLTEELLEKAINGMDFIGNTSPWTLTQTNEVAKALGITFEKYNEYDFNFMMNWFMSDMAETWGVDAMKYGQYSKFMLEKDPDNQHPCERAYEEAKKFIERYEAEE